MPRKLALGFLLFAACGNSTPDDPPADECPAPSGSGTDHGSDITGDEVWTAATSPHRVTFGVAVRGKLTIEPCAVVQVATRIDVVGQLLAEGSATRRILFEPLNASTPWMGILINLNGGGTVRLAHATLKNGGNRDDPNVTGLIDARGSDAGPLRAALHVDTVELAGSQQYGVVLRENALFTAESKNLIITGAAFFPIRADAQLAGSIPSGTYSGNSTDEILLELDPPMANDTTLRDRGVPYRLGDDETAGRDLFVGVSGPTLIPATLTIEAGVRIRAEPNAVLRMKKDSASPAAAGKLIVRGTAEEPVIFSSAAASPAAGDWRGIVFDAPDASNSIQYAVVEHAGGPSGANSFHCDVAGGFSRDEDAAIALYGQPPSAFIRNTSINNSAGDGIGRSWSGNLVDFLPTNTFSAIAGCKQSYPRDPNGACPAVVECP